MVERDPDPVPRRNGNESIETLREAYRAAVGTFMGRVTVEPSVRTNLVGVSFDSQDPEFAPRVANQLVTEFIEHNLQLKWDETAKASEWLSKQLVDVKAKLERSEDDLQAYARKNSIIFLTEDREFASAELEKLQEEVISAKAERVSQEALYKLVREGGVEGSSTARNDRLMLFVQTRLADLYRRRAELAAIFKPDYPSLVKIDSQIETFERLRDQQKDVFAEIISDQYQVAVSREKGLLDVLESQKAKVMVGAQKRIQYTILKREVDLAVSFTMVFYSG